MIGAPPARASEPRSGLTVGDPPQRQAPRASRLLDPREPGWSACSRTGGSQRLENGIPQRDIVVFCLKQHNAG